MDGRRRLAPELQLFGSLEVNTLRPPKNFGRASQSGGVARAAVWIVLADQPPVATRAVWLRGDKAKRLTISPKVSRITGTSVSTMRTLYGSMTRLPSER